MPPVSSAAIAAGRCDGRGVTRAGRTVRTGGKHAMLKWLLVTALALALFSGLRPWLSRLGIGRLPGDFNFTAFGRRWSIPLASTILLSLLAAGIARLI